MDYKEFKKEYNKIIKRIDSEIRIVLEEIKSQGGDSEEYKYTYPEEYKKFKRMYVNNESKNPKRFLEELYGIHNTILNSNVINFFSTNAYIKRHVVFGENSNCWLKIDNCYNDALRFSFFSNGKHSGLTYETHFMLTHNEIKRATPLNVTRAAIEVIEDINKEGQKITGLSISADTISEYIKEEVIKLYFNPLMKELSPKIKVLYDTCNSFNFQGYDTLVQSNDIDFSINLSQKNENKIQEEINQIKDIINITTDFSTKDLHSLSFKDQDSIIGVFTLKTVKNLDGTLKETRKNSLNKKIN